MQLPDLDSLRCFEAAAVHLSFRAAAAQVALSAPAFSERIRRLEEVLGTSLFDRTTRRVGLTPAGRRLLPQAREALEAARRCLDVVREDGRRAPFELTVGTRHELGISWLVPALDPLRADRPERTLHLHFGHDADMLAAVHRGALDAMVSSVRLTGAGLGYAILHEERYVLVAAPDLVPGGRRVEARDAGGLTLVDLGPELPLFRYFLDALDRPEVWAFQRVERVGTIAAVRARVLSCAGIAVLPRYFVAPDLAAGRLVPVSDVEPRADAFRLVWRDGDPRDHELRALAEALRARPLG